MSVAFAATASAQDYDTAGKHYAAGQERYAGKRFHTAALHFQAAYDITKDPVLLFNVGEAWQMAGDAKKAVASYTAYLKARSNAPDRADVEQRIQTLSAKNAAPPDGSVAGDKAEAATITASGALPPLPVIDSTPVAAPVAPMSADTAAPAAQTEPAPVVVAEPPAPKPTDPPKMQIGLLDDRPATKLRVAAWCTVAATIALLTTGAILGLAAQSRGDELSRRLGFVDSSGQPSEFNVGAQNDYRNLRDEGKLYNGLAIGFFTAAAAMAVTTTVLFVVDWKRGKALRERGPAPGPAGNEKARAFLRDLRVAPAVGVGQGAMASSGLVLGGKF